MPFVTICGTPEDVSQEYLEKLMQETIKMVNDFANMHYSERDVMVWFPSDRMAKGLGHEFSIDVVGVDSSRQQGYRNKAEVFAGEFCRVVATFFPQYWRIECSLRAFTGHPDGHAILTQPRGGDA